MPIPAWVIFMGLFILVGCTAARFQDVAAREHTAYRHSARLQGIEVAADPYMEEQRVVDQFGTNLLAAGVLSVYLVVHNNTGATLLFDPRNVAIYSAIDHSEVQNVSVRDVNNPMAMEKAGHEKVGAFAMMIMNPLLGWMSDTAAQNQGDIMKNIMKKHMYEKTIFDGETHSGFLYFADKDAARLMKLEKLILRMTRSPNGGLVIIDMAIMN